MKGVELVLQNLQSRGLVLGIVTAAMRTDFEKVHKNLSLTDYFNFIVTNDDTPQTKPEPDPYLLALKKSGLEPAEVVVIEDSPRGVKAAKAAGINNIIAVPTEITRAGDFSDAWQVVDNIELVSELIHTGA